MPGHIHAYSGGFRLWYERSDYLACKECDDTAPTAEEAQQRIDVTASLRRGAERIQAARTAGKGGSMVES